MGFSTKPEASESPKLKVDSCKPSAVGAGPSLQLLNFNNGIVLLSNLKLFRLDIM